MTTVRQMPAWLALAACLAACQEAPPRSYDDFMEDRLAREGTLARCNEAGLDTSDDIECANARRAAAVVSLSEEREQRRSLEEESERRLNELRAQLAREQAAAERARTEAEAAAAAQYEARWRALQDRINEAAAEVGGFRGDDEITGAAGDEESAGAPGAEPAAATQPAAGTQPAPDAQPAQDAQQIAQQ